MHYGRAATVSDGGGRGSAEFFCSEREYNSVTIGQNQHQNSRLGRLLVNRGYISEAQLAEGLRCQRETGQRLGEALVQSGWLSERELHRVLRHQTRYRHAIALAAMVSLPLQPLVSFASTGAVPPTRTDSEEPYQQGSGLIALSDEELGDVAGQGADAFVERISAVASMAASARDSQVSGEPLDEADIDAIPRLKLVASAFFPVLGYLDSRLSISGVHYSGDQPRYSVREDGALTLALPSRIDEVRLDHITVNGGGGASMGDISLHDIQFDPRSRMTFYTH